MALSTKIDLLFVFKDVKLIVFVVELIRQDVVKGSRELYACLKLSLIRCSFLPLINRALSILSEENIWLVGSFINDVFHPI